MDIKENSIVQLQGGAFGRFRVTKNNMGELIIGENLKTQRVRRVTGYLVGTLDRFNNAKRAEVKDRVKHTTI